MQTHPALDRILSHKHEEIQANRTTLCQLRDKLQQGEIQTPSPRGFEAALRQTISLQRPAIIAEIKKASPSQGVLRDDFSVRDIAHGYASNGATCLSVLTESSAFLGHCNDLRLASQSVALPVLRKDFMIDPLQIYESRAIGADCILLILSILDQSSAQEMEAIAHDLGMDVLLEVHDETDLAKVSHLQSSLIGINNRNLTTLEVDPTHALKLKESCPNTALIVAESGLHNHDLLQDYFAKGIHAFLIGETFMRSADPDKALDKFVMQRWT